ncbi:hypothetical protein FRC17_011054 [Serendipita sp. 399]|nr:hypothetical protein FRC17_011054 [Serendipita sp. 399]
MGHISAIHRTPVEIWRMIFTFALRTWLLPDEYSRLVDDLLLFDNGCTSYAEYKRIEDIRRQLRLVCKLWNAILCDAGIRLTISNFHDLALPSLPTLSHAMRVDPPAQNSCTCRKKCPHNPRTWVTLAATPDGSGGSLDSVLKAPGNARVILLPRNSQFRNTILDALSYARRAHSLGCDSSFLREIQAPRLQNLFKRLTHLSISVLSTIDMTLAPHLPRLRYLQLGLNLRHALPESGCVPLSKWKFTQLTSLVLEGFIIEACHKEILQFGLNHSTFLKNLILRYHIYCNGYNRSPRIEIPHLRQFRRLEVLGVDLQALNESVIFEDLSHPSHLSLLLSDCIDLYSKNRDWLMCVAGQCVRLCTPPVSLFDQVILLQSWDQVYHHWDAVIGRGMAWRRSFSPASTFFEELERQGIRIADRNGVGLQDGDGRKLLERL